MFAQQQNGLTMHFTERVPVVKRCISVLVILTKAALTFPTFTGGHMIGILPQGCIFKAEALSKKFGMHVYMMLWLETEPWKGVVRCMISVFLCCVNEIFTPLGCYSVHIGSYLLTFQDSPFWPLKMTAIGCSKSSVTISLHCISFQKSKDLMLKFKR